MGSGDEKSYNSIADQSVWLSKMGKETYRFSAESAPESTYLKMEEGRASPGEVSRIITEG